MQNRRGLIFLGLALMMGLAAAWITTKFTPSSAAAENAVIKTTLPMSRDAANRILPVTTSPPASHPSNTAMTGFT